MKTTTTTSFPKRLSSLGKLDKGKYVEQYIRSQKSVRVLEVIPEQVNQTSQDVSNPLSHLSSTKKNSIVNDGFRTPTLKPRIPKVQISEFPTSSLKRKNSLDEDTEKRLASRRQRKRAKREIVECKVSKEGVTGTLAESKAATKCKKAPDIPLGLTLMYGFTTNNIGSGRLTMEPPSRSIGVFSKGKSSTSTKIVRSKLPRKTKRTEFSETSFLKLSNTKKASASEVAASEDLGNRSLRLPLDVSFTSAASTASESPARSVSVVWDIERESFTFSAISAAKHIQKTGVLDSRDTAWVKPDITGDSDSSSILDLPAKNVQLRSDCGSDVSLRPSESASQPKITHDIQIVEDAMEVKESKYFTCIADQTARTTFDISPECCVLSDGGMCIPDLSPLPNYSCRDTGPSVPSNVDVLFNTEILSRHNNELVIDHSAYAPLSALQHDQYVDRGCWQYLALHVESDDGFMESLDNYQCNDYQEDQGRTLIPPVCQDTGLYTDICNSNINYMGSNCVAVQPDFDYDQIIHSEIYLPPIEENSDTSYIGQHSETLSRQSFVLSSDAEYYGTSNDHFPSVWLSCDLHSRKSNPRLYTNAKTTVELDVAKSLKNHWLPQKL